MTHEELVKEVLEALERALCKKKQVEIADETCIPDYTIRQFRSKETIGKEKLWILREWLQKNDFLPSDPDLAAAEANQAAMLVALRKEMNDYKWLKSQEKGYDVGKEAFFEWVKLHAADFREWWQNTHPELRPDEKARRAIDTLFTVIENLADPNIDEELRNRTLEGDLIKLTAAIESILKTPIVTRISSD